MKRSQVIGSLAAVAALPRAATAQSLRKVRTVSAALDQSGALFYARDLGIFEKHGLDVSIDIPNDNSLAVPSVVSNSVDIAYTNIIAIEQAYGGAKAAVEATMSTLAADLANSGVTANVLVPGGPVDTPAFADDGTVPRTAFIQPEVMLPPLRWLLSSSSAAVTGRRFIARTWDATVQPATAAERCGAPIGWPQVGMQARMPQIGEPSS